MLNKYIPPCLDVDNSARIVYGSLAAEHLEKLGEDLGVIRKFYADHLDVLAKRVAKLHKRPWRCGKRMHDKHQLPFDSLLAVTELITIDGHRAIDITNIFLKYGVSLKLLVELLIILANAFNQVSYRALHAVFEMFHFMLFFCLQLCLKGSLFAESFLGPQPV